MCGIVACRIRFLFFSLLSADIACQQREDESPPDTTRAIHATHAFKPFSDGIEVTQYVTLPLLINVP